jgi:DivIVA domain-containing protein
MRLTPAEVHNVVFKKPSIGKRGYDEDEVDAFLDLVEDELARLVEENNTLAGRLAELDPSGGGGAASVPTPTRGPQAEAEPTSERGWEAEPEPSSQPHEYAAGAALGDTHVQAARMLGLAQEMADRLTSEARAEAEQLRADTQAEAERLRTEAAAEADQWRTESAAEAEQLRTEAAAEAERLRTESAAQAEQVRAEAALHAEASARAAQEQYDQTVASLATQQVDLQKKIEDLRVYEREYRSRLRSWINDQLAHLNGVRSDA